MFVPEERRVHPRTGPVVDGEVVHLGIPPEQITLLLVDHQLLDEFTVFGHIQMETRGRLASPGGRGVARGRQIY